jgi:serine/threonine protein kinase
VTTVTPDKPAPGLILHDRYRISSRLAEAGWDVYEAIDLRLRNVVAVKHLTLSGLDADQAFECEAALLASLRHAALPVVIDYFTHPMGRFFVMQYIGTFSCTAERPRRPVITPQ